MNALTLPKADMQSEACDSGMTLLADIAVSALMDEATLTPKPGLVDLRSRGAHQDMDWLLMCHSARTLHPTFYDLAEAGRRISDPLALREQLGQIGRQGEAAMLQATGGVNTHRGAIWALGLLVAAAAQDDGKARPEAVARRAGSIARCPDRFAPTRTGHKGEIACRRYGVGGARAQAQADFPHVIHLALSCLHSSRMRGDDELTARLNSLLALIAELDDTCVLSRGGTSALVQVQEGAARVLAEGGAGSAEGRHALHRLEQMLIEMNVSPGGAADLLAATLFLDRLSQQSPN